MDFSPYSNGWPLEVWQEICPEFTYSVVDSQYFPDWLPTNFAEKLNSGVYAASGNTETYVAIFMGFRIDNDEIDEHPYVVAFDKQTGSGYGGFIHNGDWKGRTTRIPEDMERLMNSSGIGVYFNFERKPTSRSGSLIELKRLGILNGYETSVSVVERMRNKEQQK